MPVISFANPKGGSGKSTLVLVLGLEFARQGTSLAIIDADPNAVIADWAARRVKAGLHVPFTIVSRPKEGQMVATIGETEHLNGGVVQSVRGHRFQS